MVGQKCPTFYAIYKNMKYLVIDACARRDSRTKRLYEEYIKDKTDVKIIKLYDLNLKPLDEAGIKERDSYKAKGDFSSSLFEPARDFKEAENIIIAAPYWDLSFPSILKVYFENISIGGLTFGYDEKGSIVGYCKAKKLIYFTTCGGKLNRHFGYEYVSELVKTFFGVKETYNYYIDMLDIDPTKSEKLLTDGIEKIMKEI